jgi:hypothetical protein
MAQINTGRVITGGLLAGLIINISEYIANMWVFAGQFEEMTANLGVEAVSGGEVVVYLIFGFIIGLVTVWLYAAMRPRFGPGPKTAMMAGGAMWILAHLWPMMDFTMFLGLSSGLLIAGLIWTLVESLLAAVVGAWLYQEGEAAAPTTPAM